MTNSITGDYDVVVELSFGALNRILAALHEAKSEPHSFVWIVGPTAPGKHLVRPGIGGVAIGPIVNVTMPASRAKPGLGSGIVRPPIPVGTVPPSGLTEIQVSTPTVTIPVPQDTWSKITVHQWIMIYFIPDAKSTPMPEFIHGELLIIVNVALKPLPGGTTLNIDVNSKNVQVLFTPTWTSTPLDRDQMGWLTHYIREFLTQINPINVTLPQAFQQLNKVDVKFIQTLTSGLGALLLSISPNAPPNPNPGSVTADMVGGGNGFAIAASGDYLISLIQNQLTIPDFTTSFTIDYWIGSTTVGYNIHVNSVTVGLTSGTITLTITGHAHTGSHFPSPDFTITQNVSLAIWDSIVTLSALGDPSISLSGALGVIQGLFNGSLVDSIKPRRDDLLQQVQASFQSMLNSQTQSIIQSINSTLRVNPQLGYSGVRIESEGIILYGNVSFQDRVPVHVEFAQKNIRVPERVVVAPSKMVRAHIPVAGGASPFPTKMVDQIELNALGSWIPGGTIGTFIWSLKRVPDDAHPHVITEQHRFVTRVSKDIPRKYICLTVEGTRVTGEAISGEQCVSNVPIPIVGTPEGLQGLFAVAVVANPRGQAPKPVAYVNPWASGPVSEAVSNETIIHFADPHSVEKDLATLREALVAETQLSAFVVVVLPHERISKIGSIELPANYYLAWADEHEGRWQRTFKVNKAPATVILNRSGVVVWHEQGLIPLAKLKTALKQNLLPGLLHHQPQIAIEVGKRPPDFKFEYHENTEMTLRNFYGQPVTLIFWASWSEPSLEELEYLQKHQEQFNKDQVILLINGVDEKEKAKETLKKHHITYPLIEDEQNQIGQRYGINCWPTIITIDAKGIIRNIYHGTTTKPIQSAQTKTPIKSARAKPTQHVSTPAERKQTHKPRHPRKRSNAYRPSRHHRKTRPNKA